MRRCAWLRIEFTDPVRPNKVDQLPAPSREPRLQRARRQDIGHSGRCRHWTGTTDGARRGSRLCRASRCVIRYTVCRSTGLASATSIFRTGSSHPGDCDRELSVTEQPAWRQGRRRGCDHPDWGPDGQRRRQCFGLVRGDAKPAAALARPRLAHEFGQIIQPQAPNDRGLLRHSHAAFIAPGPRFESGSLQQRVRLSLEVARGERIRDKIAASKKKGMWTGGVPPLGYRVHDRRLVIVVAGRAHTVIPSAISSPVRSRARGFHASRRRAAIPAGHSRDRSSSA
jgi:hypothetical protein